MAAPTSRRPPMAGPKYPRRFDQRRTVFGRMMFDRHADYFGVSLYRNSRRIIRRHRPGYSHPEFARSIGAWTVYDHFAGAFTWRQLTRSSSGMRIPALGRHRFRNTRQATEFIKATAKEYGAALVGICRLNRTWIYSHDLEGRPVRIPRAVGYAIVMAIAMDPARIGRSPDYNASAETGTGYSRTAALVACLAQCIRYLGFRAIPMGNDTALSIPLAIDAGLGQLGRNGLLITREHGPCVRLGKVFTDLPLLADRPVEFGITEYCRKCRRCVEACSAGAIQGVAAPSYATVCRSNNEGILRWAVDHDRCYRFWVDNGCECSNCIAACPFTHHPAPRTNRRAQPLFLA